MQRVEQVAGFAVDQRAEFAVGEERAVQVEHTRPAGDIEWGRIVLGEWGRIVLGDAGAALGPHRLGQVRLRRPLLDDGEFGVVALGEQVEFDTGRLAFVQVAPSLAPRRRAAVPAAIAAGQRQFGGFGETRFAAAVAADDQGESGTGRHVQGGLGADPAESADPDGAQEDSRGVEFSGLPVRITMAERTERPQHCLRDVRGDGGIFGQAPGHHFGQARRYLRGRIGRGIHAHTSNPFTTEPRPAHPPRTRCPLSKAQRNATRCAGIRPPGGAEYSPVPEWAVRRMVRICPRGWIWPSKAHGRPRCPPLANPDGQLDVCHPIGWLGRRPNRTE